MLSFVCSVASQVYLNRLGGTCGLIDWNNLFKNELCMTPMSVSLMCVWISKKKKSCACPLLSSHNMTYEKATLGSELKYTNQQRTCSFTGFPRSTHHFLFPFSTRTSPNNSISMHTSPSEKSIFEGYDLLFHT